MSHKIKKEECINCGACEDVCPVQAISEIDFTRFINPETCIDCAACTGVCPVACIFKLE